MKNLTKAIHALIIGIGLACLLYGCASSKGEGCQNGFAGYGQKVKVIKGPHR